MKDLSLCCVYDNFEKGIDVRNNIEEFLIAAGKKKDRILHYHVITGNTGI